MKNGSTETKQEINVDISEVILTPMTCAALVNEIIKGLLYKKSQIPYPYSWLKTVVDKKRGRGNEVKQTRNFTVENYYRVVSTAYDTLKEIMRSVECEFCDENSDVKQIIVVFGSTPQCAKEVFTINISSVAKGHSERNHHSHLSKYQQKILRNVFFSELWMDTVDTNLACTNTYIILKKDISRKKIDVDAELGYFTYIKPLVFSPKTKHVHLTLNNCYTGDSCCNNLVVFEEDQSVHCENVQDVVESPELLSSETEQNIVWCQAKDPLKGFKDCFINKVSACELW